MRTKASKASKGEDEGGFEGLEGEDEYKNSMVVYRHVWNAIFK